MNYFSWVYYFSHLCHGYEILDHLVDLVASSSTMTPTDPPPKDAEWTKIDFIIRSWIFSKLAPSLRKRLVDLNPTTAKDAWTYIAGIFQDNKHQRAMALKAKLHNLKLGDLSIDWYFQKIESIVLVLNGLGSPLSNDDVVTFALEGLPSTYETISTVIVSQEPFLDIKTVRSLLTTHEMRLKSRVQNPLVDATSASPMVLLAKSKTSARCGPSLEKVNNPCYSFAKGSCRFGDAGKYLHNGVHGKSTLLPRTLGSASSVLDVTRSDFDMLQSLLAKFGLNAPYTSIPSPSVAYTVSVPPGFPSVSAQLSAQPTYVSPQLLPGSFGGPIWEWLGYSHRGFSIRRGQCSRGSIIYSRGFRRFLVHRRGFTLYQDLHSRQSVYDRGLTTARGFFPCDTLNMCIYPSVAVGDGRFIPVTNSGHSFVRDNSCTVKFDPFSFSVNDFITRWVLLHRDSTGDLYPVTKPSTIPHAFLTSQYTWHQRLGHPGSEVLHRLVSSDSISCNKEKLPVLCHAC
nr:hybrid signal transduction histidine kinase M [Tanacetum cinerariifolium]